MKKKPNKKTNPESKDVQVLEKAIIDAAIAWWYADDEDWIGRGQTLENAIRAYVEATGRKPDGKN
jgi:hypothetical protein